ncbi:hypothetical protein BJY01DRAFT_247861 [Aspergillus pseudoustus]|uniref:Transcription factor Opi1-domain-containing protein n=1 Tax=Aspergillus pseudoustus TaxID=1810923 RepID=A0ABR4JYA9_9EURO
MRALLDRGSRVSVQRIDAWDAAAKNNGSNTDTLFTLGGPDTTLQNSLDSSMLVWDPPVFPEPVIPSELLPLNQSEHYDGVPDNHTDSVYDLNVPASAVDHVRAESPVLALERRLNLLSQQLCDLAAKIPQLSIWRNYRETCPSDGLEFHIDEAFAMADAIVEVGKLFVQTMQRTRSEAPQPAQALGLASLLTLLSCYSRVMDIWALIFVHTRNCARESLKQVDDDAEAAVIRVPHVQIGSFTASIPAAVDLHLSLMARSTTQVEKSIRELMNEISSAEPPSEIQALARAGSDGEGKTVAENTGCGARGSVAFISCSTILERASAMVAEARNVAQLVAKVLERDDEQSRNTT